MNKIEPMNQKLHISETNGRVVAAVPTLRAAMYTKDHPLCLRSEVAGQDRRYLSAYVDGAGGLHVDGHDLGPSTAPVSDDGEYEWFQTIHAADVPRLLAALGAAPTVDVMDVLSERFTGAASYELERVLRESGIPVQRDVWSG